MGLSKLDLSGLWENRALKVYILDDSPDTVKVLELLFKQFNCQVKSQTQSAQAIEEIISFKPDLIMLDKMMPGMSGIDICRKIKSDDSLKNIHIAMTTSKVYDSDKNESFEAGADDYIHKPVTAEKIKNILSKIDNIEMKIWGARGTMPVPGERSLRYGGNTNCVTLTLPGDRWFIFDAGTGIKELSNYIMKSGQKKFKANILITHHHWDHINAFPYFAPLYIPGNKIEVYGPHQGDHTLESILSDQMDGVYFPVTIKEFAAHVGYNDLDAGQQSIDNIAIEAFNLNHPGICLGYKISYKNKTIVYMTDNELFPTDNQFYCEETRNDFLKMIENADHVFHDTTYFDEEYPQKICWGHSSVGEVVRLAHDANVKNIHLIHHDPDQTDDDIDRKRTEALQCLDKLNSNVQCHVPSEGSVISI